MSAAAAWTGARIDPIERRDKNLPALRTARAMALHATCASRTNHQAFAVVNDSTTSLLWVQCFARAWIEVMSRVSCTSLVACTM